MTPKKGNFAKDTDVPEDQTRTNIERVLSKYGATGYGIIHDGDNWRIVFKIEGRMVQMDFSTPQMSEDYRRDAIDRLKPEKYQKSGWEQAKRSYWRAIYNVIKFKLEAVAIGYSTVEREFLSDVLMHDGSKIGDWIHPQIEQMYKTGKMPPMLPEARKQ